MTRVLTIAVLLLALTSCADVRFYVAGYAGQIIHRSPLVLTTRVTSCGQVLQWVRMEDADKMVAVCDSSCNCKLVKAGRSVRRDGEICR